MRLTATGFVFVPRAESDRKVTTKSWIKRLGFWGLVFFLVKGLLWLVIPALIAILAAD
jgi:hypothetical protein